MRSARVAVAFLVVAGIFAVAIPSRADASVDGSWWSEANTGVPVALPVAVPTVAVSSDLMVQQLPNGPAAVAGIRLPVPAGTVPTTLTIHLVTPGTGVSLAGCATTDTWASASGGPWAIRPTCSGPVVPVVLASDGMSGTLDVSAVDQARIELTGIVEVLIAPAAGSTAFSASLSQPVPSDLVGRTFPPAAPAPADNPPSADASTPPAAVSAPRAQPKKPAAAIRRATPIPVATAAKLPAVTGVSPAPPVSLPTADSVATVPSAEAAAPAPVLTSEPATGVPVPGPEPAAERESLTHTNRRLPALLLLLLALVSVAAFPMRTRVPVLLTSRGAAAPESTADQAGLGRHRKPRTGRPPRL